MTPIKFTKSTVSIMTESLINNNPYVSNDYEVRSIDGTGNNLENPEFGSAGSAIVDRAPLDYADGVSEPSGEDRANPRVISNAVAAQTEDIPSDRGLTNFIWAFGQFLDHDLDLVPESGEEVTIEVPLGDPDLDPNNTGEVHIPIGDSAFIPGTGTDASNPRQLPNNITAWIDGSNIYGSDDERAEFLRSFEGGKLKVSDGNLLPFNDGSVENDDPRGGDPSRLFVAGDVRANENSVLVSMHTLFVREHNRIAEELSSAHPDWTDEEIFERARDINIAQYQSIIYNEYIPSLLGVDALPEYSGYNSEINPGITRTFATAAFRVGHTQLSSVVPRLDVNGETVEEGNLTLSDVFFRPSGVIEEAGIDPIVRGIASSLSQNIDTQIIGDVRNLLFNLGDNLTGRDLFAINLERGRLHGLADYNTIRETFGLERVSTFAEITSNTELQETLEDIYEGDINNIDAFVGLLAEDHVTNAAVGETLQAVLVDQFVALRDGDRFYYENTFSDSEITEIENTSLSDIIRYNTDTTIIQDNAFSLINEGTNGSDVLEGGLGDDSIFGGGGRDTISGYAGDDLILGERGNDFINGGSGDDVLDGGRRNDRIIGGDGDDTLIGGAGTDILTGGGGADDFVFGGENLRFRQLRLDIIEDFDATEDQIVVSEETFGDLSGETSFGVADSLDSAIFSNSTIIYEQSTGVLIYNQNGDTPGFGRGGIFARLDSDLDLSADNFDVA